MLKFRNASFHRNPHPDLLIKLYSIILGGNVQTYSLAASVSRLCLGDINQSSPDPHVSCFRGNRQVEDEVGSIQPMRKKLLHEVERVVKVFAERRAFVLSLPSTGMDEVFVKLFKRVGDEDADDIFSLHGERGLLMANNAICLRPIVGKDASPALLSPKQEFHQ